MKLARNLMAGLASSIWTALIGIVVVPFYLKHLGIEAYGLIGFFVTTQSLFQLLDLGLAPAINREVARGFASNDLNDARSLLRTLAVIYWFVAIIIIIILLTLSPHIAEYWLKAKLISQETVTHALMLMGLVIACRWPIGLYQSVLIGAQRLMVSSSISITMATLGSVGAIAVLAFVSPTIQAFFIWQAIVGLIYVLLCRWAAWHILGRNVGTWFDIIQLKRIWRFSLGLTGIAMLTVVFLQLDKILLSKILGLDEFGHYILAGVIASGLLVLLTPVFNVIYPRMSALVVTGDTEKLKNFYRSGTRILSIILFPIAIAGAISSQDIILIWTSRPELIATVSPITSLLLIGNAVNGIMIFPYALQLAYGKTRLPLAITISLIVIFIPMTISLVLSKGAVGGAFAWLILNGIYLFFGTWLTHRFLLKGIAYTWLMYDVLFPFSISLLVILVGWRILYMSDNHFMNLAWGAILAILAFLSAGLLLFRPTLASIRSGTC